MSAPTLITQQSQWDEVCRELAQAPELAIDTEANSMYAYRGRICLIQIASPDGAYILDPLKVDDLSNLGEALADPAVTKVMHGSDYDIRSFYREYGFRVEGLFDTEICARFLGMNSPNLAAVLETYLGVSIPKSRRLQRSNWGRRPLSAEALDYAASDVLHLGALARKLTQLLTELGRLDWVREEFSRLERAGKVEVTDTRPDFLRVRGSHLLEPMQLAVLKELFEFREEEAEKSDIPVYRVMSNEALVLLAREPRTPLEDVPGISPQTINRHRARIHECIQRGQRGPAIERPPRPRFPPPTREVQDRLKQLKAWRTGIGASLDLDPALIWPAASLERLSRHPQALGEEVAAAGTGVVRVWQAAQFGCALKAELEAST